MMKFWYILALFLCSFQINAQQNTAQAWLQEGRAAYARKEWDTAVRCFTSALQADATLDTALYNRGLVYLQQEKYTKAISDLSGFISGNPADAGAYVLRAEAYFAEASNEEAMADLNHALELLPTITNYLLRAKGHMLTENYISAEKDFQLVLQRDPKNAEAYLGLGDAFFHRDDFISARNYYREATEQNPDDLTARLRYGIALARVGNYPLALQTLSDSVIQIWPEEGLCARAYCHFQISDLPEARRYAEMAKSANISHADAWHILGMIAAQEGKHKEALTYFDEVIAIDAGHAQAWYNAGKTLYEDKDFTRAFDYLSVAVDLLEVKGPAAMALANLKLTLGDDAAACKYFNLASQMGYQAHAEENTEMFCK
jgi:tetratricopeptide (TPR) repeat protein